MKQQRALVTGATGFIGSHLVQHLVSEGWTVHIICRPNSNLDQLTSVMEKATIHRCDGAINSLREIMQQSRPDVVFHLASLFLSEHQPPDIQHLIESNILFGTLLAEAMRLERVRYLVNTGTSWQNNKSSKYNPVNLYAATKQAYEDLLQYYVEVRDLDVITLKLFDTYGPNDKRKKLINLLLSAPLKETQLLLSPGDQLIDFVYISDIVRAYVQAAKLLTSGDISGYKEFYISSAEPLSVKDLVLEIEQALGVSIPIIWGGRPYRNREVMKPFENGEKLPGWTPYVKLKDGLKKMNYFFQ